MSPNQITAVRIALVVPLLALLMRQEPELRWAALAVFLFAGLTDVVDGKLARARGQTSALGAMLDLMGDRLLTLTAVVGLLANGTLNGVYVVAGFILVARCVIVAGLQEALPGRLGIRVSAFEKIKIAFQWLGLSLLIAPPVWAAGGLRQHELGRLVLAVAAALTLVTIGDYALRARRAFREA